MGGCRKRLVKLGWIVVLACLGLVILSILIETDSDEDTAAPTEVALDPTPTLATNDGAESAETADTPMPTDTPAPSATPAATNTPVPSPTPRGYVHQRDFGDNWPFTVEDGILTCDSSAVTFRTGTAVYAVNGMAMSWADEFGWRDIDPIWRDHPSEFIPKVSIAEMIRIGLSLCE